jgi:hypothetical protein
VTDDGEHWVLRRATFYVDDEPKNGKSYQLRYQSPSGDDADLIHTAYLRVQHKSDGTYEISPEGVFVPHENVPDPEVQTDIRTANEAGVKLLLRGWKGGTCAYYLMPFLAKVTPAP